MKTTQCSELHPAGEGDFVFPTYGGSVRLSATGDALTPFGGLVPWAAFVRRCGLFERLGASCPVVRTSPNATPVYDVLQSDALTVLCDGDRFAHVRRLRCDPTLAEPFGVKAIVSDDTIRRLFAQVDEAAMEDAQRSLGTRRVWLNRVAMGFGHERIMAWHEAGTEPRPHYLFKLRLSA